MFDDSQIWLMIGIILAGVVVLTFIGIIVNAYITSRRLAIVLADVEEVIHNDFKGLEQKIEAALMKVRMSESKANRE